MTNFGLYFDIINLALSVADPLLNYTITYLLWEVYNSTSINNNSLSEQQELQMALHLQLVKFFIIAFTITSLTSIVIMTINYYFTGKTIQNVKNKFLISLFIVPFSTPFLPFIQYIEARQSSTKERSEKAEIERHKELAARLAGSAETTTTTNTTILQNGDSHAFYGEFSKQLLSEVYEPELTFFRWTCDVIDERVGKTFYGMNIQSVVSTLPHLTAQLIASSFLRTSLMTMDNDQKTQSVASLAATATKVDMILFLHNVNLFVAMLSVALKSFQIARSFSKKVFLVKILFILHDLFCFAFTLSSLVTMVSPPIETTREENSGGVSSNSSSCEPHLKVTFLRYFQYIWPFNVIDLERASDVICFTSDVAQTWFSVKTIVVLGIFASFAGFVLILMFEKPTSSRTATHYVLVMSVISIMFVSSFLSIVPLAILLEMMKLSTYTFLLGFFRSPFKQTDQEKMILLHHFLWKKDHKKSTSKMMTLHKIDWQRTFSEIENNFTDFLNINSNLSSLSSSTSEILKQLQDYSALSREDLISSRSRNGSTFDNSLSITTGITRRLFSRHCYFFDKVVTVEDNRHHSSSFFEKARHVVLYHRFHLMMTREVVPSTSNIMKHNHRHFDMLLSRKSKMYQFIEETLIRKRSDNDDGFKWYHFIIDPPSVQNIFSGMMITDSNNNSSNTTSTQQNLRQATTTTSSTTNNTVIIKWKDLIFSIVVCCSIFLTLVVSPMMSFYFPVIEYYNEYNNIENNITSNTRSTSGIHIFFLPSMLIFFMSLFLIPEFIRYFLTSSLCALYTSVYTVDVAGVIDSSSMAKPDEELFRAVVGGCVHHQREQIPEDAFNNHVVKFLDSDKVGLWGR